MRPLPKVPAMASSKRILVIDDEKRMADSVCQLLGREGYHAVASYSGQGGLDRLDEQPFDVVVTDLRMADVDGIEVMRRIRQRHPDTLVIVMTGHASTESAIEAIHQDAFDYVPKPFEFERLLDTVKRAFERLQTERLRADMISMISHDIKVPLTSIIGYTTLMRDRKTGAWHVRAEEFLNIIASNANKILALLDNYLTTCKIEAGRLALMRTPVQIRSLCAEIESVLAPEADKRHIRFEFHCPEDLPPIDADENLIFRALCNVAANALKYSPPNSAIHFTAEAKPASKSPLRVESLACVVENPGPGIPPDELPHVFDRYRRTRTSKGVEGSGIGLFVVKTVVEAHGGTAQAESQPGAFTRFTIHLPLAAAATPA
jgi:signal transduction histidine kinase